MIWLGDRFGLFEVDWGRTASLRMHRVVADVLRGAMSQNSRELVRSAVLRGLVGYAPNDAELEIAAHRSAQAEIQRHLVPAGALRARDWPTRHLVVTQIQYVARYGDSDARTAALELADGVRELWVADPADGADLLLRLDEVRANLFRELGRYQEAAVTQLRVRDGMRGSLGNQHIRTLQATSRAAWHLQALGRFAEARIEDNIAYEGLRQALGADHPITLRTAHNLSYSLFLAGETRQAVLLEQEVVARWEAQTGTQAPMTWRCVASLGRYLHHLGEYQRAYDLLDRALDTARAERPAPLALILQIQRDQAAIRRAQREPHRAYLVDTDLLWRQRELIGRTDPETLAFELAVAADEHALGRAPQAAQTAERVWAEYQRLMPDHPYRYLCQLNLAVFQHSAGAGSAASVNSEQAAAGLRSSIGEHHPWTLAAAVNRLATLAATSDPDELVRQLAEVANACCEYLREQHPYARVAVTNHAAARAALAGEARSGEAGHAGTAFGTVALTPIVIDMP